MSSSQASAAALAGFAPEIAVLHYLAHYCALGFPGMRPWYGYIIKQEGQHTYIEPRHKYAMGTCFLQFFSRDCNANHGVSMPLPVVEANPK